MAKAITAEQYRERFIMTDAADKTALIFHLEKRVYMSLLENVRGLPVELVTRTDDNGVEYRTVRLALRTIDKLKLRDKGAALLGTVEDFFADFVKGENKGLFVERKVIARYHGIASKPGTPYYKAGDALIAGMQVQIKYENGTLATVNTINRQWRKRKG